MTKGLAGKLSIKHLGGVLKSIEPIIGNGEVNKVYIIKSDFNRAVLRVNNLGELGRFQKEHWCIEQSMSAGIPGAKIYDVGTYKDYAYILMEYIDGSNGTRIEASPGLWQELGSYLNLIHKIPVKGFGEKLNDITDGNKEQWKTYLKYNIDSLNDNDVLIKLGVLDTPTSKKLITIFQGIAGNSYTFGLNHGDYSLANVIVNNKSTAHIIDWGCAQSHVVPHYDLGVILDESLSLDSDEFNALLNGYGMSRYDFDVMKQEIADLVLLEAVDKLRWALDKAPKWVESHKSRLINILQAL